MIEVCVQVPAPESVLQAALELLRSLATELSSVPFGTSCSPEGVQKLLTGASFVNVDCS